jgi:F-type H+-transporting ATPase subunit a
MGGMTTSALPPGQPVQCPGRGVRFSARLLVAVAVTLLWGAGFARAAQHPPGGAEDVPGPIEHAVAAAEPAEEPTALEEVMDTADWHFFHTLGIHLPLPNIAGFQLTKYMLLEVIAAALILVIYIPLARRLARGDPPRGAWDNLFETLLTFVRDHVARPALGEHDADRFLPFLWTLFLFILFNNLLGIVPLMGSATASIYVTGALALCVFFAIHGSAVQKMGAAHYIGSLWPHIDVPIPVMGIVIKVVVFIIEIIGVLVRNGVLAVRLFANMFAGHTVLATILLFIVMAAKLAFAMWAGIAITSVVGVVLLSLLEIFVACLQAYIFVFLAALFMGLAMHPAH